MKAYQDDFIDFILQTNILTFGEFTLKSGRVSPYFFNASLFNDGARLQQLGTFYARAIDDHAIDCDVLFGPAYKGIPLAIATALALKTTFDKNIAYSFNRKEAKDHGEGGNIVGQTPKGDVLIVDDVITAGTAIGETMALLSHFPAKVRAVLVAFDRQERGYSEKSAIQAVEEKFALPVISIIKLSDVLTRLSGDKNHANNVEKIQAYQQKYGL